MPPNMTDMRQDFTDARTQFQALSRCFSDCPSISFLLDNAAGAVGLGELDRTSKEGILKLAGDMAREGVLGFVRNLNKAPQFAGNIAEVTQLTQADQYYTYDKDVSHFDASTLKFGSIDINYNILHHQV